jgi:hypothetical protein
MKGSSISWRGLSVNNNNYRNTNRHSISALKKRTTLFSEPSTPKYLPSIFSFTQTRSFSEYQSNSLKSSPNQSFRVSYIIKLDLLLKYKLMRIG